MREPERYGWGWALSVGNPNDAALYQRLVEGLPDHPAVGAATAVHSGCGGSLDHGDEHAEAPLIATEPLEGSIQPQVQSGRLPNGPGEVALGAVTARQLGAEAGDVVQVGSGDCGEGQQPLTVTGIAVFNEALLATRIGEGALVDVAALEPLGVTPTQGVVLVDPPEGTSAAEAREALRADYGRVVAGPIVPGDLDALDRVRSLPALVAAFIAVLALGTLGFTLGSGLRRSRRDVAVLKAMGFTPAQARRATFVHALGARGRPGAHRHRPRRRRRSHRLGRRRRRPRRPEPPRGPARPHPRRHPGRPARGVGHRGSPGDARRSHRPVDHPASRVRPDDRLPRPDRAPPSPAGGCVLLAAARRGGRRRDAGVLWPALAASSQRLRPLRGQRRPDGRAWPSGTAEALDELEAVPFVAESIRHRPGPAAFPVERGLLPARRRARTMRIPFERPARYPSWTGGCPDPAEPVRGWR